MAIVMLAHMRGMYPSRSMTLAILAGSALIFADCVHMPRSRRMGDDVALDARDDPA